MMTQTDPAKRPTAADVLKHHAFWPQTLALNFLQDLSNCLEGVLVDTTMDVCAKRFESLSLTLPWFMKTGSVIREKFDPHQTWENALCEVIKDHALRRTGKRRAYDFTLSCKLLRFIRNLHNHFTTLPNLVRQEVGSLPDQFLVYWLERFPLLIDTAFVCFIEGSFEYQDVLTKYYTMTELDKFVNWRNSVLKEEPKKYLAKIIGESWNISKPVQSFTGRSVELKSIDQLLNSSAYSEVVVSQTAAIIGLGGIGKTQLARKYAQDYYTRGNRNVFWINSETEVDLRTSFTELGKRLRIVVETNEIKSSQSTDFKLIVYEVYQKLSKLELLIIFDNAPNYESIREYLPDSIGPDKAKPFVLITSRNRDWNV